MDIRSLFTDMMGLKGIRYGAVAALGFLALFLMMQTVISVQSFFQNMSYGSGYSITVTGTGSSTAIPDTASISFGVTETAATAADAQTAATKKMNAALEVVKKQGVAEKDIKTTSYNVSPHYEYVQCFAAGPCNTTPKVTGYDVSQRVTVKLHDTQKAGALLEALATVGVTDISGPDFVVDDTDAVKAEARAEAIKMAEDKARVLARQLGVSLGKIQDFSEDVGGSYPQPMMARDSGMGLETKAVAPSLPVGENEYTSNVSITYEIR